VKPFGPFGERIEHAQRAAQALPAFLSPPESARPPVLPLRWVGETPTPAAAEREAVQDRSPLTAARAVKPCPLTAEGLSRGSGLRPMLRRTSMSPSAATSAGTAAAASSTHSVAKERGS
jgi:hypothetical protein